MGNTVWVLTESQDEDERDHSLVLHEEEALDKLAVELGVNKLSSLYDHSVLAEEFGGDEEPNFVDAAEVKATLEAILSSIKNGVIGSLGSVEELIEELDDCLKKVNDAEGRHEKVRLAIIP